MKFFIGLIVVLLVAGGIYYAMQDRKSSTAGIYCGGGGTLVNEMPIQSHRSYCIKSNASTLGAQPNAPVSYSFSIIDDQGNALKDFATVHEKIMHLIVVRKDLAEFQHVHPTFDSATGEFTMGDLVLPTDGQYRFFADFTPDSPLPLGVTISDDVTVGDASKYSPQPVMSPKMTDSVDDYQIKLVTTPAEVKSSEETTLSFTISKDGKPVTDLEEYLGALGHVVILREDTLEFIHAHPADVVKQTGTVPFIVSLPFGGIYAIFGQFQHQDVVRAFDFAITAGQGQPGDHGEEEVMDHSMH